MRNFWYYGLRLRTDLALVGLPLCSETDGAADLDLRLGHVPEPSGNPGARFSFHDDGAVLVTVPGAFRLMASGGRRMTITLANPEPPVEALETCLLSAVAGVVLHQRGAFPLHASSVMVGGRAIAFTGPSGSGKSTLAGALVRHGYPLLSDDITVVRFDADGTPMAIPGSPHLRLMAEAAETLGIDGAGLRPTGWAKGRKKVWRRPPEALEPVPLRAIVRIEGVPGATAATLTRLSGANGVLPLPALVYRVPLGCRLGRGDALVQTALQIAARVPIFRLARPDALDRLAEIVELVTATL
ncbi:hypothetical protein M2352_005265 [Azospirillum fermentarium]|uniref:hypothetical protein n=1 Tax=Azospirillum fermentarium TaxID=1233114 RepID=UPI00222612F5|nr:hypothetical protein [Azospirillum fermentarium]MCW2249582.1 hypothetical protein [Azospirillum fermentarium]